MIEELSKAIWDNPQFQGEYEGLVSADILQSLLSVRVREFPADDALDRLMQSAVHFSSSSDRVFKESAYRIATCLLRFWGKDDVRAIEVIRLILTRLGNFPAVGQLSSARLHDTESEAPLQLWCEEAIHRILNSRELNSRHTVTFTDFQAGIWNAFSRTQTLVVTAPTSAGKSFALQHYLASEFSEKSARISVYLVPTRALITQVSEAFSGICDDIDLDVEISTIPISTDELGVKRVIYVLTQERLQMLLEKSPDLKISTLAVDEAQLLGDSARGIILQSVIERVRGIVPLQTECPD